MRAPEIQTLSPDRLHVCTTERLNTLYDRVLPKKQTFGASFKGVLSIMTAGSSFRVYRKWMMGAWPLPSLSWLLARIIWQRRQSGQLVLGCLSPAQSQVQPISNWSWWKQHLACVPPDLQIPVRSAFLHEMSHQTLIWVYCAVLSCWTLIHRQSDGRNHRSLCLIPNISVQMIASLGGDVKPLALSPLFWHFSWKGT